MDAGELVVDGTDTFRVDRRAYTDPALLAVERRRIFDTCWIYAAHASELPNAGDFVTRTIAGRPMIVVRGADGELRALVNACAHRGTMVCKEVRGNTRVFRCPYHAWSYDTLGRLRGVPGRDAYGPSFSIAEIGLPRVRLDAYRELLFVTFAADPMPLPDYLAGAAAYLDDIVDQGLGAGMEVVPGSHRYAIASNWKLLAENSIDSYHVVALHGRYMDYVGERGVRAAPPRGRAHQLGNGHAISVSAPPVAGRPVAYWGPPMPTTEKPAIAELQRRLAERFGDARAREIGQTSRQLLVFPNLIVNDTCATTIRTWDPVGHDRMTITAWALVPRDPAVNRELALKSFLEFFGPGGFATPDDVDILEACQQAFAHGGWNDYSRGMARAEPSFDDELQVRAFWRHWRELMSGERSTGTR